MTSEFEQSPNNDTGLGNCLALEIRVRYQCAAGVKAQLGQTHLATPAPLSPCDGWCDESSYWARWQ